MRPVCGRRPCKTRALKQRMNCGPSPSSRPVTDCCGRHATAHSRSHPSLSFDHVANAPRSTRTDVQVRRPECTPEARQLTVPRTGDVSSTPLGIENHATLLPASGRSALTLCRGEAPARTVTRRESRVPFVVVASIVRHGSRRADAKAVAKRALATPYHRRAALGRYARNAHAGVC